MFDFIRLLEDLPSTFPNNRHKFGKIISPTSYSSSTQPSNVIEYPLKEERCQFVKWPFFVCLSFRRQCWRTFLSQSCPLLNQRNLLQPHVLKESNLLKARNGHPSEVFTTSPENYFTPRQFLAHFFAYFFQGHYHGNSRHLTENSASSFSC